MKRIKIETADKTYLAKPLTLGQMEKNKAIINGIVAESEKVRVGTVIPIESLKKQAHIVTLALQNHDKAVTDEVTSGFSILEIVQAFTSVVSGVGLEEIPEGEGAAHV